MKLSEMKKEMLAYIDFYGGDIPETDDIKRAKSKKDLSKIIEKHRTRMEDMLCDAQSHLDNFKKRIVATEYENEKP